MSPLDDTTVLFDLDGTLVDSVPDVRHALNVALDRQGRAPRTIEQVKSWVGEGANILVRKALLSCGDEMFDTLVDTVLADFLNGYAANPVIDSVLFPGVFDMLDTLKADGARLCICTNKPSTTAGPVMDAFNLTERFSVVLCGDQVEYRKPDGRHILETLDRVGGRADRAVMVGDSENDSLSAQSAGVPCVLMTFGYTNVPSAMLPAVALADDLKLLPGIIRGLFSVPLISGTRGKGQDTP